MITVLSPLQLRIKAAYKIKKITLNPIINPLNLILWL